jgi:uncharacterized protein YndB with AHSA1/START domain
MIIDNASGGVVRRIGETYELVFVRRLNRPIERVWAALTTPERLADWLAEVDFEDGLRVGGRFDLRFPAFSYQTRCEIVAIDPPRLFAWTWGPEKSATLANAIRFELQPDGDGCILTLTNPGLVRRDLEGVAAGWHAPLAALPDAVDGVATPNTPEREKPHLERYTATLAALT